MFGVWSHYHFLFLGLPVSAVVCLAFWGESREWRRSWDPWWTGPSHHFWMLEERSTEEGHLLMTLSHIWMLSLSHTRACMRTYVFLCHVYLFISMCKCVDSMGKTTCRSWFPPWSAKVWTSVTTSYCFNHHAVPTMWIFPVLSPWLNEKFAPGWWKYHICASVSSPAKGAPIVPSQNCWEDLMS